MDEHFALTKEWIAKSYDKFNIECFGAALPSSLKTDFEITHSRRNLGEFRHDRKRNIQTIRISDYYDRSERAYANTLLHEMCHAYVRKRYGDVERPHGPEWNKIACHVMDETDCRYGEITCRGCGEKLTPDKAKPRKYLIFTDRNGIEGVMCTDKPHIMADILFSKGATKDGVIYSVATADKNLSALPKRRTVRWNRLKDRGTDIHTIISDPLNGVQTLRSRNYGLGNVG